MIQAFDNETPWQHLAKRKIQHYGYKFDYPKNTVNERAIDSSLPPWTEALLMDIYKYLQDMNFSLKLNQLTINCYNPGDGIAFHSDSHSSFCDLFVIVSLGSDVIMDFRTLNNHVNNDDDVDENTHNLVDENTHNLVDENNTPKNNMDNLDYKTQSLVLAQRSILILSGDARWKWEHCIRPRKIDLVDGKVQRRKTRYSLTFRTVKAVIQHIDPAQCPCNNAFCHE